MTTKQWEAAWERFIKAEGEYRDPTNRKRMSRARYTKAGKALWRLDPEFCRRLQIPPY